MQGKINKSAVERLQPGELLADTEVKGFVARCLPSGNITYGYRYRAAGTQRWLPLGTHGKVTAEQARKAAKMEQGKVAVGQDPSGAKQQAREDATNTVNMVLDTFLERHVRVKLRSTDQYERAFSLDVRPAIGARSIYDLKRSDIVKLHDGIAARGTVMADRTLAFLRGAFIWQVKRDDRFQNPIPRGLTASKPADERARKRILDDQEIRDLWAAADLVKTPKCFPLLVKVLLLTMRRRKELAGITWDEIGTDGIWTIPAARHKTGKKAGDLYMPMTPRVLDMLGERRPGFVFTTSGKVPFAGFDYPTIELRKAMSDLRAKEGRAPVANFTLHDLRRTGRSLMSRARVWPDVAELCLGHTLKGVKAVYDRHDYEDEKRDAFERLGEMIDRILDPAPANVVPLQRISKAA